MRLYIASYDLAAHLAPNQKQHTRCSGFTQHIPLETLELSRRMAFCVAFRRKKPLHPAVNLHPPVTCFNIKASCGPYTLQSCNLQYVLETFNNAS